MPQLKSGERVLSYESYVPYLEKIVMHLLSSGQHELNIGGETFNTSLILETIGRQRQWRSEQAAEEQAANPMTSAVKASSLDELQSLMRGLEEISANVELNAARRGWARRSWAALKRAIAVTSLNSQILPRTPSS